MHILIIRLSALGDILRTLPALHGLRRAFPEAHLTWLAQGMARDLLGSHPQVDEWLYFPREEWTNPTAFRAFWKDLRAREYDLVLDFHGRFKSAALAVAARGKRKVGFAPPASREGACFLYREIAPCSDPNRVAQSFALLHYVGARPALEWKIPVPPEAQAWADAWRNASPLGARPYAVLFSGTSRHPRYGTTKEWSEEGFAHVGRRLRDEAGLAVVLPHGPGEEARARRVAARMGEDAHVPPPTSLSRLAALLKGASLYVGGDTGPTHLAWLLRVPTAALFLVTSPEVNGAPPGVLWHRAVSLRPNETVESAAPRVLDACQELLSLGKF